MAVALATQIAQQLQPDGTYHWIVTIGGKTRDFGVVYNAVIGAGPVNVPGGKAITAISPTGLITFSDASSTQLVFSPGPAGKSAKQIAIDLGVLPANASDTQYMALNKGPKGDSIKGDKGDSVKGDQGLPGPSLKPGLLATNTGLPVGNAYRLDETTGQWFTVSPRSQELLYNIWGVSDQDTDIIAPGNVVKVNGSAFVAGKDYYLETVDANGCNYAPLPASLTPLLPTAARAFVNLGRAFKAPDGTTLLRMPSIIQLADGAAASKAIVLDPTDLPLGTQLSPDTLAYLLDAANGKSENGGQDSNKVLIDGDAAGGAGFMASPIIRRIGSVGKGVFVNDVGYGGIHLRGPVRWPAMSGGDFLFLFQVGGSNNSLGLFFGYGNGVFYAVRVYGGPDYIGFRQYAYNGYTWSETSLGGNPGTYLSASIGAKTLGFLRLNWNGATLKARAWKYDTSKGINPVGLLRQGESEPASWDLNYTHSAAIPAGRAGYLYQQDYNHVHLLSYSSDPNVPAPYGGA